MKSIITLIAPIILNVGVVFLVPDPALSQRKDTAETKPPLANNYYLKTAKVYLGLKDYAKAVDSLELAILLEPNHAEAHTLLKESRRLLEGEKTSPDLQGKTHSSEGMETPASAEKDPATLLQSVYTAIEDKRYDDAGEIIHEILTADPTNEEALYLKEKMLDIKHKYTSENLKATHMQEKLKSHEHLKEASIPYQETLLFPEKKHWNDIVNRSLPELDKIVEENKRKNRATAPHPKSRDRGAS